MPRISALRPHKGLLRDNPEAVKFIEENYSQLSLTLLSEKTGVSYSVIAEHLRRKGLQANRSTTKRINLEPFMMMPEMEVAYMAGIVDGEGTISVGSRNKKYIQPTLSVANTSARLHDWLTARAFSYTIQANQMGTPYYRFSMTGWHLEPVLRRLLPYLVIKKPHALLLLHLIRLRVEQSYRTAYTPLMLEIVSLIRELNERKDRMEKEGAAFERFTILSQQLESILPMEC